jgi:uncharacterized Zn-finger protein
MSFACDKCEIVLKHKPSLKRHMRTHTDLREFKCDFPGCEVTCKAADNMMRHKLTHSAEKHLKCTFEGCSAAFRRTDHLDRHHRYHTGEKPYKCECGAAYASNNALKTHTKFYHTIEGQQKKKREEERIAGILQNAKIDFKREHLIKFDCAGGSHGRIDFVIILKGRVIFLEIDEDQHSGYDISCDTKRMALVHECCMLEGNTLPILFIRYNPHVFKIDGKLIKIKRAQREKVLLNYIQNLQDINSETPGLCIQYMFYNLDKDHKLTIWDDDDYPNTLKNLVLQNISG